MKPVKLGLMGCGTVGTGVARLLLNNRQSIEDRVGIPLILKHVADSDATRNRGIDFAPGVFINDAWQIVNDPEIEVVIEMIGGETLAKDLILTAIEKGKHVVTANKALLALHGNEILSAAAVKGVDLCFEASVAGCIPIVKSLREALVANQIHAMVGILNGTCNYILSKITQEQIPFDTALAEAQTNGYAEADPTLDIEGLDAAHKLAIITALAYGIQINFNEIFIEGISAITPLDIQFAAEFGYRIKLLAISKHREKTIEARVHPTMIPFDNILSNVNSTLNAITISGHAVKDLFFCGHGAGMMPTASAVLSDIVDLARNLAAKSSGRVPLLAFQPDMIKTIPLMPVTEVITHYYFRFTVLDQPGVLSAIAGILGNYGISIRCVHQKGRKTNDSVPIVMLTHRALEADVQNAMKEIMVLEAVRAKPLVIRIENDNQIEE